MPQQLACVSPPDVGETFQPFASAARQPASYTVLSEFTTSQSAMMSVIAASRYAKLLYCAVPGWLKPATTVVPVTAGAAVFSQL
jgi:hypothetical protein